jgi:hypothetical protein
VIESEGMLNAIIDGWMLGMWERGRKRKGFIERDEEMKVML